MWLVCIAFGTHVMTCEASQRRLGKRTQADGSEDVGAVAVRSGLGLPICSSRAFVARACDFEVLKMYLNNIQKGLIYKV